MGDTDATEDEKIFYVERAPQGKAGCKKCKAKCNKGEIRIAKLVANMFGNGTEKMKQWHHLECIWDILLRQRLTTKRIEGPEDIGNFENMSPEDQTTILEQLESFEKDMKIKHGDKYTPPVRKPYTGKPSQPKTPKGKAVKIPDEGSSDNLFREFRRLCADIANESSYLGKTELVKKMLSLGKDGNGFKGDVILWCKLLLPAAHKRIYNLQSKQLIKIFSRMFLTSVEDMMEHLEQGDISDTIYQFFEKNKKIQPAAKSLLTLQEVDDFLQELAGETTEDRQIFLFKKILPKCTANDLKTIIRLVKHDLRMNAGAKHILEGVHPDAYAAFQSTHDLESVINRCLGTTSTKIGKNVVAKIALMTPVLPMLAEPCKTVEQAMKKCPNGMYSEIKYDGERVQLHKSGNEFKYFSRSLKPVLEHKIKHFKDYIPQAFPHGKDLILDSEILMMDAETGKPLPFGTLGKHKQTEFEDASVCLFIFDCIYFNGEDLSQKPLKYRRKILQENMTEIPNHVMFSEMKFITKPGELAAMIAHTLKQGLEGLVLKDICSVYEPGKRHWLKVKKDYLFGGAVADSADLVVLGAWFGTGKKGGMMSVFLMGCYDPSRKIWCTVTKVHTGHDDATLERLQGELQMVKISCDPNKVPNWLHVNNPMVPDFVAKDPKNQPVWEITGAEFSQQGIHTADRISIRFPRVTKIRDDKDWETATSLPELKKLYKISKEQMDDTLYVKLGEYYNKDFDISTIGSFENTPDSPDKKSPKKAKKEDPSTSSAKKERKETKGKVEKDRGKKRKSELDESPKSTKVLKFEKKFENFKQRPDKPFPDVFKDVQLAVPKSYCRDNNELIRYFIAYGGNVSSRELANYVIHVDKNASLSRKFLPECFHVTSEWLRTSISNKCLQDSRPYIVHLS